MPALFEVRAAGGGYAVMQERGALDAALANMRDGVVIADDHFAARLETADVRAIVLPAAETTKSLDAIGGLVIRLRQAGAHRGTHLWAVGGGVIQDVAAFVASIYMRGLAWTYVPTTLLGMVDSCIGGKSSINVGAYKNIVGTFHTPRTVLIDPLLTATLSVEQRVAGLAEAAKICFCRGSDVFAKYLALTPEPGLPPAAFEPIIALSLGAKRWFIEIDEFDRAERLLLNFGHTFGHALEGASGYRLSHGVAVGVGVLCALELGRARGSRAGGDAARLEAHMRSLLGAVTDLPAILRGIDVPTTIDRLRADKKHAAEHYRFVLVDGAGRPALTQLPKSAATDRAAADAIHNTLVPLSG